MDTNTEVKETEMSVRPQQLLLVDDEPHILRSLQRVFRTKNFEIYLANSGAEALQILSEKKIQVMVTDHKMPNMTGVELIDIVKQDFPNVVSIMLSGQADYEQVIRVLNEKSAMRFIKKPWCNKELVQTIEKALKHFDISNYGTWLNRVNRSTSFIDSNDFDTIVERYKSRSEQHFVAALHYSNIAELAKTLGQDKCEKIQAELVNVISLLLPELTEFFYYEPGLLLITLGSSNNEEQIEAMLANVMAEMITEMRNLASSVRLELRAAYQHIDDFTVSSELLVEQLKASIQSADALRPLIKLDAEFQNKLSRQHQIKAAIAPELDSGHFSLVIQPKVTLKNKLVESGEILLRWQHSTLGWISPMEFIRLAELDGQINQVGNWVLEHGISLISRVSRFSPDIKSVSINVSARQLFHVGFVERVQNLLTKYQIKGSLLELEITETCISEDPALIKTVLGQLKALDVLISVDDFGSGGTAYSFLTQLPIDILKLDKCLIDDLLISKSKAKLVKSLIDICQSLGIEVVAEGVEDEKTIEILESMQCDKIQGFVYSKAVKPIDFEKLLVMQPYAQTCKRLVHK
jgi:EAL domain-containing protein (putative c-di-GMP-specific phosphodiesterase class I)/response regulator RpfG family c-di-GMP phosphodiesterase